MTTAYYDRIEIDEDAEELVIRASGVWDIEPEEAISRLLTSASRDPSILRMLDIAKAERDRDRLAALEAKKAEIEREISAIKGSVPRVRLGRKTYTSSMVMEAMKDIGLPSTGQEVARRLLSNGIVSDSEEHASERVGHIMSQLCTAGDLVLCGKQGRSPVYRMPDTEPSEKDCFFGGGSE